MRIYLSSQHKKMRIKPIVNSAAVCSLKPYTLAGFKPGYSVTEVDAPRHQCRNKIVLFKSCHSFPRDRCCAH
jgi:hypothetical protein